MTISVICACKNRNKSLQVSLNSWLFFDEISEFIIVDWSSDEPLNHLTRLDKRIKIIRVNDEVYFNQPQPLNLAANIATGDYILKMDTDYIINPYYNFFDKYTPDENSFVCGKLNVPDYSLYDSESDSYVIDKNISYEEFKQHAYSYNSIYFHLNGLLFIKKENYLKVGGYNENLGKFYAYEDDEMPERLKLLGLNEIKIDIDDHLIHLPHPDKKRLENFEGKNHNFEMVKNNLSKYYQGDELEWQTEYAMTQMHIELNKIHVDRIEEYYVEPKTKWKLTQIDNQNYSAEKMKNVNLNNFPTVYYLSLEESVERQNNLEKEFKKYGVANIVPIISKRFSESNDIVTGKYIHQLNAGTTGCAVSHLKAIKHWYENTEESYGFFCEDDISLETVPYWNFTWNDFIESLPEDADCIQLVIIRDDFDTFEIRERYWDDWSATAYILTRDYAKKIIDHYIKEDSYHLEVPNFDIMPLIENLLFKIGKVYSVPLFVENTSFSSTFSKEQDDDVNNDQKNNHYKSSEIVLNWWKSKLNLQKTDKNITEIEELLTIYSLDTEDPMNNFNLGNWYWKNGHTAPALSYFLRCAERATDDNLAYEALIWSSYCYDKQGTRDGSAKGLLQQAICLLPNRPEAYFLLSRFTEKKQWWQDTYITASQGLSLSDFNSPPLILDVEYPGKYGLLYEKAIAAYWWGKHDECISLFTEILTSYENVKPEYIKSVHDNLNMMGIEIPTSKSSNELIQSKEFSLSDNFDWSELTYEDIITIDREIIHEQVYRFWRDVNENDIVVDIGASVGPFVCSILPNKPQKVYCVEPSKTLLKSLAKNCAEYLMEYTDNPLVYINHAIINQSIDEVNIFGHSRNFTGITFNELIKNYNLQKVNFLKIDCEGGEYNVFKDENMDFLLHNVEFIAMETHLNYPGCREKFKNFRDKYLVQFDNFKVMSCTRQNISWGESLDIKDRIFDNEFIDNYTCEFMIYIKNK